jgi:hypothetical protein
MGIFRKDKELKQNLSEKAEFHPLYMIQLLFERKPIKPTTEAILKALKKKFGEIDVVSSDEALTSFAVKKYKAAFKEGVLSPQVLMMDVQMFKSDNVGMLERSQLWNVENGEDVLNKCQYSITISDMMASVMEYKERCELLIDWLEVAVELFPECKAIWMKSAGKLFTANQIIEHNIQREDRFVYFGVNVRFFSIKGTNDKIVDTLGLYAIGLPDIQYHFHDIEPNAVVNHAYNVASYIFDNNAPIKNDQTIDGIVDGQLSMKVQWKCHYEMSLIQPEREVMDICPGKYASGERKYC